jgi:hypothetical protein
MLASKAASVDTPWDLNERMEYFFTRNFFIRATQEMREIDNNQLELLMDKFGKEYLRYIFVLPILSCNLD